MPFASRAAEDCAEFWLADGDATGADSVALWLDLRHDVGPEPLERTDGGWTLRINRPPVQRLEYLFVVSHGNNAAMVADPGNPLRVRTAFGDHSVLEFPEYRKPAWIDVAAPSADRSLFSVLAPGLLRPLAVTICSPPGSDPREPMPMLAVHDGPEFDSLGDISHFSAAMTGSGRLPRHRLALLSPGDRNRWYAALPAYAQALQESVFPAVAHRMRTNSIVLHGASLGGLAALHAATRWPELFDGLFLQSGSFFQPGLDAHESSFGGFAAIAAFTEELERASTSRPIPIGMTCGRAEENLANNERMAQTLSSLGHHVQYDEVADAHTFTGWRDAFDPYLVELVSRAWSQS